MRINNNVSSLNAQNSVFKVDRAMSKTLNKLSTGLRINSAADDAAGLAVSENLRTQVRGVGQAIKNTQDAIALLTIADGALNEQANILQRMRELVVQGKNDTYTQTERNYMGQEYLALFDELDRIAYVTNYNGMTLFANRGVTFDDPTSDPKKAADAITIWSDPNQAIFGSLDNGAATHFNMMVGANYSTGDIAAFGGAARINAFDPDAENLITIQLGQMDANGIFRKNANFAGTARNDLVLAGTINAFANSGIAQQTNRWGASVQTKLNNLLSLIDGETPQYGSADPAVNPVGQGNNVTGLQRVDKMRAYIGAMINRLEYNLNNLMNSEASQQAAESVIRDTDFASETMEFTKQQILHNTGTSMLAQANVNPYMALRLLGR